MSRFTLDQEIKLVQDEMLLLGSLAEQAILNSVDALRRRDVAAAKAITAEDKKINDKHFAIENHILIIFATQSPLARDLRLLAAMLEVITELERIGDYAKGIARGRLAWLMTGHQSQFVKSRPWQIKPPPCSTARWALLFLKTCGCVRHPQRR